MTLKEATAFSEDTDFVVALDSTQFQDLTQTSLLQNTPSVEPICIARDGIWDDATTTCSGSTNPWDFGVVTSPQFPGLRINTCLHIPTGDVNLGFNVIPSSCP